MEEICQSLAALLSYDPGQRLIPTLSKAAPLAAASRCLLQARRVLLVSGFYIGRAQAWETDGPLGSLVLADTLERAGVEVTICTDTGCLGLFSRAAGLLNLRAKLLGFPPGREVAESLLAVHRPDAIVAIERTGQAADGRCYNASGFDVSDFVAHFDSLFMAAKRVGIATIAVGDGGNELGFGTRVKEARRILGQSAAIACVTAADHLIACGVSNWGAYALAAIYAHQRGIQSRIDQSLLLAMLQELVAAGAVDGIALKPAATVDGLPIEEEQGMFTRLLGCTQATVKTAD